MKYAIALLAVSAMAMVLIIVHGVVQEMNLRDLKKRGASSALAVDTKEQTIMSTKNQVAQLRIAMETERTKAKELAKRQEEIDNAKRESEAKLQACNSEKARGEIKDLCYSPASYFPDVMFDFGFIISANTDPRFILLFLIRKLM